MSAGKVLLLVFGTFVTLVALALLAAGGAGLWAQTTQRDEDGFFTTGDPALRVTGVCDRVGGGGALMDDDIPDWLDVGDLATVRVVATGTEPDAEIFIGIARARAVSAYLAGVARSQIRGYRLGARSTRSTGSWPAISRSRASRRTSPSGPPRSRGPGSTDPRLGSIEERALDDRRHECRRGPRRRGRHDARREGAVHPRSRHRIARRRRLAAARRRHDALFRRTV